MPIESKGYLKDHHKVFGAGIIAFLGSYALGDVVGYPKAGYIIGSLLIPTIALLYSGEMSTRIEDVYKARYEEEMGKIIKLVPKK